MLKENSLYEIDVLSLEVDSGSTDWEEEDDVDEEEDEDDIEEEDDWDE